MLTVLKRFSNISFIYLFVDSFSQILPQIWNLQSQIYFNFHQQFSSHRSGHRKTWELLVSKISIDLSTDNTHLKNEKSVRRPPPFNNKFDSITNQNFSTLKNEFYVKQNQNPQIRFTQSVKPISVNFPLISFSGWSIMKKRSLDSG